MSVPSVSACLSVRRSCILGAALRGFDLAAADSVRVGGL